MKTIRIILLILVGFLFLGRVDAQHIYRTQSGEMLITAISADTVLTLKTKDLVVLLDYENAKFVMRMDKSTFVSGNDDIDSQLELMVLDIIEFKGKLDVENNINLNEYTPIDFAVEGILSINNKSISGTGQLYHIAKQGVFSSLLTLKFNLNKDELGLDFSHLKLEDDVQIEVVQLVLNNVKDI